MPYQLHCWLPLDEPGVLLATLELLTGLELAIELITELATELGELDAILDGTEEAGAEEEATDPEQILPPTLGRSALPPFLFT